LLVAVEQFDWLVPLLTFGSWSRAVNVMGTCRVNCSCSEFSAMSDRRLGGKGAVRLRVCWFADLLMDLTGRPDCLKQMSDPGFGAPWPNRQATWLASVSGFIAVSAHIYL